MRETNKHESAELGVIDQIQEIHPAVDTDRGPGGYDPQGD
jgi:hypothetical protein